MICCNSQNSHASISAAVRAERGLPEDLIRLCVGIEDPRDLLDDLEHALLEAGAIYDRFDQKTGAIPDERETEELFKRDPEQWAIDRASRFKRTGSGKEQAAPATSAPTQASSSGVTDLVNGVKEKLGLSPSEDLAHSNVIETGNIQGEETLDGSKEDEEEQQHIVVSAPGKVIMFGEHAVVHGAVGQ